MKSVALILYMGIMSRLSGNGFGQRWNMSWMPEVLFALPFGMAFGHALSLWVPFVYAVLGVFGGWAWSYLFMQSGTWTFLSWEGHKNPDTDRTGTLKPIVDWLAGHLSYSLGDEGYSWVSAGLKGFLIGLPVGGIPLAILWPLGYEIGSHADKVNLNKTTVAEVCAGMGGGISISLFLIALQLIT